MDGTASSGRQRVRDTATVSADVLPLLPLTPLQARLLAFQRGGGPGAESCVVQAVLVLRESMIPADLQRAWETVVARHAALRLQFVPNDIEGDGQRILPKVPVILQERDWRQFDAARQRAQVEDFLKADRRDAFQLTAAPLFRLALLRLAEEHVVCVFTHHAAVLDEASRDCVLGEVMSIYAAIAGGSPVKLPVPGSFASYLAWLRRLPQAPARAFWRKRLGGAAAAPLLPLAGGRGTGRLELTVELGLDAAALMAAATRAGVSSSALLVAAWAVVQGRYCGQTEVLLGRLLALTNWPGATAYDVGIYTNIVPLRVPVRRDLTIGNLLRGIEEMTRTDAEYEHLAGAISEGVGNYPCGIVLDGRTPGDAPPRRDASWAGRELSLRQAAPWPLAARLVARPGGGLGLHVDFAAASSGVAAVRRFLGHVRCVLQTLCRGSLDLPLAEIDILDAAEVRAALVDSQPPELPDPAAPPNLLARLAQVAAAMPEAAVLRTGAATWSWRLLMARAAAIGSELERRALGPDALVAVCTGGPHLLAAVLGAWRAGLAVLLLDPDEPHDRLEQAFRQCRPRIALTDVGLTDFFAAHECAVLDPASLAEAAGPATSRVPSPDPETLALVWYSVSRGLAYGVRHAQLVAGVAAAQECFRFSVRDVAMPEAPAAPGSLTRVLLPCLLAGGSVSFRGGSRVASAGEWLEQAAASAVTVLECGAAVWAAAAELLPRLALLGALRSVIVHAETATEAVTAVRPSAFPAAVALHRVWGGAESCGLTALGTELAADQAAGGEDAQAPVVALAGAPGMKLVILGAELEPQPPGVVGDVCVTGARVALPLPEEVAGQSGVGIVMWHPQQIQAQLRAAGYLQPGWLEQPQVLLYRTGCRACRTETGNAFVPASESGAVAGAPGAAAGGHEQAAQALWHNLSGDGSPSPGGDFFQRGGDATRAAVLLTRCEALTGVRVPGTEFRRDPTLAGFVTRVQEGARSVPGELVPLRTTGTREPLFVLLTDTFPSACLAALPAAQPVYSLNVRSLCESAAVAGPDLSVAGVAAAALRTLRGTGGPGKWHVCGLGACAPLAVEVARQRLAAGEPMGTVALLDYDREVNAPGMAALCLCRNLRQAPWRYLSLEALALWRRVDGAMAGIHVEFVDFVRHLRSGAPQALPPRGRAAADWELAVDAYPWPAYSGPVELVVAGERGLTAAPRLELNVRGGVRVHTIPGTHSGFLMARPGSATAVGRCLARILS